jgi:hypothetical protein
VFKGLQGWEVAKTISPRRLLRAARSGERRSAGARRGGGSYGEAKTEDQAEHRYLDARIVTRPPKSL